MPPSCQPSLPNNVQFAIAPAAHGGATLGLNLTSTWMLFSAFRYHPVDLLRRSHSRAIFNFTAVKTHEPNADRSSRRRCYIMDGICRPPQEPVSLAPRGVLLTLVCALSDSGDRDVRGGLKVCSLAEKRRAKLQHDLQKWRLRRNRRRRRSVGRNEQKVTAPCYRMGQFGSDVQVGDSPVLHRPGHWHISGT